jgi:hypothetical protein
VTSAAEGAAPQPSGRLETVWLLFGVTWPIAVLFHLAGNTRLAPDWGRAALGVAAIGLLARPRSCRFAVALAAAVLLNVWLEAPLLSNHFLLHGLVALTVLGALTVARGKTSVAMASMSGPLRLLLLVFYAFAAFAKLNTDFFDPAVSCGVFFLEESARSWGLGGLVEGWASVAQRGVAVLVAAIELAIPVLLVVRRTRAVGVVLALVFHFVLALDRSHQFFDFSSVLLVLFLLFLPLDGIERAHGRLEQLGSLLDRRWASGRELLRLVALAGAGLVVLVASGPGEWPAPPVLRNVGVVVWLLYGAGGVGFAVTASRGSWKSDRRLFPAGSARVLLVVPVLALLNGLTPYVELKTAASWNMYSNLAVVDGESNHLLIGSGLPLTDAHERLVEVVAADRVGLDFYIGSDWRVPELMLVDHLADRPGAVVVGVVDGETVRYEGGEAAARPMWQRKTQVFRAVDGQGPVSCQPSFGPAR